LIHIGQQYRALRGVTCVDARFVERNSLIIYGIEKFRTEIGRKNETHNTGSAHFPLNLTVFEVIK
jgi:hypothetical protein